MTMFHVIEHVADPPRVAERVARWLAPGGVFAVETPNLESLDARLFRERYWGGYHFPRHWHLYPFRGLPFLAAFTAWDRLRATLGFHTSAMLMIARKPGSTA